MLGSGRRVQLLRSNIGMPWCWWRAVFPNRNTDCVKMVKQIYPCDQISKNYTHKTKDRKKRVYLTAVEIYIKSDHELRVAYQCQTPVTMSDSLFWPCTVFIWWQGEAGSRYAGTLCTVLHLPESNIFQNKKFQFKKRRRRGQRVIRDN